MHLLCFSEESNSNADANIYKSEWIARHISITLQLTLFLLLHISNPVSASASLNLSPMSFLYPSLHIWVHIYYCHVLFYSLFLSPTNSCERCNFIQHEADNKWTQLRVLNVGYDPMYDKPTQLTTDFFPHSIMLNWQQIFPYFFGILSSWNGLHKQHQTVKCEKNGSSLHDRQLLLQENHARMR